MYKILCCDKQNWKKIKLKKKTIWFKGYLHNNSFLNILKTKISENKLKNYLLNLDGLFAFIIEDTKKIIACVDRVSSIPIFYLKKKNKILISNKSYLIANSEKTLLKKDSLTAIYMSGYTIGDSTIYNDVKRVNGGNYIEIIKKKSFKIRQYYSYNPWKFKKNQNLSKLEEEFNKCNYDVFKKIIKYCNINKIGLAVSATAGYDSRLTIAMLKELKFKNFFCFTYGLKNNYEVQAAKKICEFLKVNFHFIEINNKKVKKLQEDSHYISFCKNLEQGLGVADTWEFLAIKELQNKKLLKNKAVINGLSGDFISGGHQLEKYLDPKKKNINQIIDAIIKKHYQLWIGTHKFINKNSIKKMLKYEILKLNIKINNHNKFGIIENLELNNRQSKYSLSRQQIYDYFNLKWILPHFDSLYLDFWEKIEPKLKTNQFFYDYFLTKKNYANVWSGKVWYNLRIKRKISPPLFSLIIVPFFKVFFSFNKRKYHNFYTRYLDYFTHLYGGYGEFDYFKEVIKQKNIFRNFVSLKVDKYIKCLTTN